MTGLRIGKRGRCSWCDNRTDLAWRGHYRQVQFTLDRRCFGRYSDVCRAGRPSSQLRLGDAA